MQVTAGGQYAGPVQCTKQLLATEGIPGLARGMVATMARESPGNAIFFTTYEALRRVVPGRGPLASGDGKALGVLGDTASAVFCGGVAGTVVRLQMHSQHLKVPQMFIVQYIHCNLSNLRL